MNRDETGIGRLPCAMHPSWNAILGDGMLGMLEDISTRIGLETYPPRERILRFLETDAEQLRVIILGQDPYPAPGAATGRAFEVGGLTSWLVPFRQVSLKNMLRAIRQQTLEERGEPPAYSLVKREIEDGSFRVLPPDRLFAAWEAQGVLLLNTALSIRPGEPGSHAELWQPFTARVVEALSRTRPDLHWFLWGAHAARMRPFIRDGRLHVSRHPMMCSPDWPDDFLKNRCFAETASLVDWTGMSVVQ